MNLRTVPATIALGVVGLLVLAGLSWVVVIGPKLNAMSQANEERIALEDRNTTMLLQLSSLQRLVTDLPKARQRAEDLALAFPPTASQPGFFAQVNKAALAAGINPASVTTLSPGVPVLDAPVAPEVAPDGSAVAPVTVGGDLARQVVGIDVTGTFDELSSLLQELEEIERAMLAATVALATTDEGLTLTLTGTTFVAPPLGDPPTGTP